MFRRLGYPWELQVERIQTEYNLWLDVIITDCDYEHIHSVRAGEITFDKAGVEVDLRRQGADGHQA